ncbi:hypothetical protein [Streptosporangium sp. LJ11]|uniref:hypothetical protein n=1 Tax=Streptosporangium sp. LJ11 TaxID=3436927 RepID=UPI003F7A6BAC
MPAPGRGRGHPDADDELVRGEHVFAGRVVTGFDVESGERHAAFPTGSDDVHHGAEREDFRTLWAAHDVKRNRTAACG